MCIRDSRCAPRRAPREGWKSNERNRLSVFGCAEAAAGSGLALGIFMGWLRACADPRSVSSRASNQVGCMSVWTPCRVSLCDVSLFPRRPAWCAGGVRYTGVPRRCDEGRTTHGVLRSDRQRRRLARRVRMWSAKSWRPFAKRSVTTSLGKNLGVPISSHG
mgnify:CR=1 FL=1